MGPRLGRRGNQKGSYEAGLRKVELQWGHALGGVETAGAPEVCPLPQLLQWGHALGGVETPPLRPHATPSWRFNGATPWEAWKHKG